MVPIWVKASTNAAQCVPFSEAVTFAIIQLTTYVAQMVIKKAEYL